MQRNRGIVLIIVLLFISILFFVIYFSLSYIPLFNIKQINISGINTIPLSVERIIAPYYGVNRFKINTNGIKKELEELPIIFKADVNFEHFNTMVLSLELFVPEALASSSDEYFIVKNKKLIKCTKNDFKAFDELPIVEISKEYSSYLMKFGVDQSFEDVLFLISQISLQLGSNHNLITKVKYDNNNTDSFGLMVLEISSLNTQLSLRDKVDANQIIEAVKLVEKLSLEDKTYLVAGSYHKYDIYKHALVKRK